MPSPVPDPQRMQARRDRNYRLVARPSRWGNPYLVEPHGPYSREESIRLYEDWLDERSQEDPDFLEPLRGYNLGCSCAPHLPCHADILLRRLYGDLP